MHSVNLMLSLKFIVQVLKVAFHSSLTILILSSFWEVLHSCRAAHRKHQYGCRCRYWRSNTNNKIPAVVGGRAIDAVTGRRSKVNTFIRKNRRSRVDDPTGPKVEGRTAALGQPLNNRQPRRKRMMMQTQRHSSPIQPRAT